MTLLTSVVPTPMGRLTLVGSDDDVLLAAAFEATPEELRRRLPVDQRDAPIVASRGAAHAALSAYFGGDVGVLDTLTTAQPGGDFQQVVWREMRRVPAGATVSYGELAARAGRPRGVRAVGQACARNAVCVVVPCHRVVRGDGALGGYRYGPGVKRRLLDHEQRH